MKDQIIKEEAVLKEEASAFIAEQQKFIKGDTISIDGNAVTGYMTIAFSRKDDSSIRATVMGMNMSEQDALAALKALALKLGIPVVEIPIGIPVDKRELN